MSGKSLDGSLVVAISSRALFDLSAANAIYEQQGEAAYAAYQIARENEVLAPGVAFPLVEKLLQLNQSERRVEVILLSRNSADSGLRIFNSIQHYGLDIVRAAFTTGKSPYRYAQAFHADLFLSAHAEDTRDALAVGCAAATLLPDGLPEASASAKQAQDSAQIRIAFDGDSVIFSDEAEQVYKQQGLDAFTSSEQQSAEQPLAGGPFKGFLKALHLLQQSYPKDDCPIHTALITARQAPAHERVIRTLRAWKIRIDESIFLGGLAKGEFLQAFAADIFFDDQTVHCQSAQAYTACGHVPYGVANSAEVTSNQ